MRQWVADLVLGHKKKFARNCVKKMEFYFLSNSVMNSLKCPKSKSVIHCFTELFPFYQNKHWTIQRGNDWSVDPSFHCIIFKIVGFQRPETRGKGKFMTDMSYISPVWVWLAVLNKNETHGILCHVADQYNF